jgi:hypothetical protein
LIVDDVEHHGRLVGRGEDKRRVKVPFRSRAVANPADRDLGVVLDRRGHGPADRLDVLGGQVAGDREEAMVPGGVEHRQLAAFEGISLIGVDLAHHVGQGIAAGDQEAGLAIGREVHVPGQERLAEGAADRLLAHVLHVERGLALPLRHEHAGVEGPQRHHILESLEPFLVGQETSPRSDRFTGSVENADHQIGEISDGLRIGIHSRARNGACFGDLHVREVGGVAGADCGLRDMERERRIITH